MTEREPDIIRDRACGTAYPPPDGSHDREQIDRFADFLRFGTESNSPAGLTDETFRYLMGEDVAPTPVDDAHPAAYVWRKPLT